MKNVFVSYHYNGYDVLGVQHEGFGSYLILIQLPITQEKISDMVEAAAASIKDELALKYVVAVILNWQIL